MVGLVDFGFLERDERSELERVKGGTLSVMVECLVQVRIHRPCGRPTRPPCPSPQGGQRCPLRSARKQRDVLLEQVKAKTGEEECYLAPSNDNDRF